jgi:very-short-patch-repair endonuclease
MLEHARVMRRFATRAEGRVWKALRNRSFSRVKFRRQVPIGPYIVDFYCISLHLVIELDGKHHRTFDGALYDDTRTRYLAGHGITVLRIPNELLISDPQMVESQIHAAIEQALARS